MRSEALQYIENGLQNGVPERNRTSDPRFRKRGFAASRGCKRAHATALGFTRVHETVEAAFVRARERGRTSVDERSATRL
jgi:hypothetical protein